MSNMSFKEFMDTTQGKTVDDVVAEVKKMKFYELYVERLKENKGDMRLLGSMIFLETMKNKKLDALTHNVAYELLFSIIDQKLRTEILESEE